MQNFKKRYLYCLLIIASLLFVTPVVKAKETFTIVASVNGDIVTSYDLSQRQKLYKLLNINRTEITTLKNLTDELLQKQYAENTNIQIKNNSFEKELTFRLKKIGVNYDQLKDILSRNRIDIATFDDYVKADILWREILIRRFSSKARISDYELNKPKPASPFKIQEKVELSEIIIPFTKIEKEKTILLAERLYLELKSGADFKLAARRFSKVASSKDGGYIGFVQEESLPQIVISEIENMMSGEISKPIITSKNVFIFKFHGKSKSQIPVLQDYTVTYRLLDITDRNTKNLCDKQFNKTKKLSKLSQLNENLARVLRQSELYEIKVLGTDLSEGVVLCEREINLSESEFRQLRSNYFNREMKLHSEKLMMELYGQSTIRYSN